MRISVSNGALELSIHMGHLALQRRRGTVRTGLFMRVSTFGWASYRSRSVNAAMTSGASNALFRRPTFTCWRIPASTSRSIAAAAGL
ncbi:MULTISPECIES: hypothetical protein [Acidithrix]|uniref:hypothetical protein n=1 Tax=Acidithrix TaxID=1609233 RepID=UPI00190F7610|nr:MULTISPECIES: hypothetical protein [Acidithrix]